MNDAKIGDRRSISGGVMVGNHLPCLDCGSSDGLSAYEDGTYCHVCRKLHRDKRFLLTNPKNHDRVVVRDRDTIELLKNSNRDTKETLSSFSYKPLSTSLSTSLKGDQLVSKPITNSYRSINSTTFGKYGVTGRTEPTTGHLHSVAFPYGPAFRKVRLTTTKDFFAEGSSADSLPLFGMDRFAPGSAKAITITEGELDALSVYQMMGDYPCVSIKGASSARRDCERAYKYLDSFEKIYLCFDADVHGEKAAHDVATLFDVNKVYHVVMGGECKDANDYLTKGKQSEFTKLWWNAKKFLPKGIVNSYSDIKEILGKGSQSSIATYPFPTLQDMTYGIREAELNLFTAMEKVGKTEIMRAIEYHLLKTTEHNIGIIHLEEEEKRSVQGLLSYELDCPVHLPDCGVSLDDQVRAYEKLTGRDGRLHFYTHFGSDDPDSILDAIRYLVNVCHCKFIFLDHITMLVTGYEGEDERRKLDYLSTRLAMLTRELRFTLFLVSHVNDAGQTRGSRNISKVADLIVSLDRDCEATDFDRRNTTTVLIKGNRFAAKSGPAGYLIFDPTTYKIKEKTAEDAAIEVPF